MSHEQLDVQRGGGSGKRRLGVGVGVRVLQEGAREVEAAALAVGELPAGLADHLQEARGHSLVLNARRIFEAAGAGIG